MYINNSSDFKILSYSIAAMERSYSEETLCQPDSTSDIANFEDFEEDPNQGGPADSAGVPPPRPNAEVESVAEGSGVSPPRLSVEDARVEQIINFTRQYNLHADEEESLRNAAYRELHQRGASTNGGPIPDQSSWWTETASLVEWVRQRNRRCWWERRSEEDSDED